MLPYKKDSGHDSRRIIDKGCLRHHIQFNHDYCSYHFDVFVDETSNAGKFCLKRKCFTYNLLILNAFAVHFKRFCYFHVKSCIRFMDIAPRIYIPHSSNAYCLIISGKMRYFNFYKFLSFSHLEI